MAETRVAVEFRQAAAAEAPRAASLMNACGRSDSQFFVAMAPTPVERIVAAATWNEIASESGAPADVRFDWTVITGWRDREFPVSFLQALARRLLADGARSLRAMRLVDPRSWEADAFRAAGFQLISRHEHFRIEGADGRPRQDQMLSRLGPGELLPSGGRIEPVTIANSAAVAALIQRHGLLAIEKFWKGLRAGVWQEFSAALMRDQQAEGVLLASQGRPDEAAIHVLAANPDAAVPGGLVCYELFQSLRCRCDALGVNRVYFWAEPDRSPATRLIAQRFGGKVVGETVQFALSL